MTGLSMTAWLMLCFFFCFVHLALWPATRTIPAPLLPLAYRCPG